MVKLMCRRLKSRAALRFALAMMVAVVAASVPSLDRAAAAVRHDRASFVRAIRRVHPGMTRKQVRTILGKPDAVHHSYTGNSKARQLEWIARLYGVDRVSGLGTLGEIEFDGDNKVSLVVGGHGDPPPPGLFTESELRRLLCLIDTCPPVDGYRYNPLPVIRIVNALQPLGKSKALAALSEYMRIRPGAQGPFLVLRTLFEVPEPPGYMPFMAIGAPQGPWLKDPHRIPRFPIVLQDDVPLLAVSGYAIAGFPQPAQEHIAYFARYGTIRSKPLRPPDRPLRVVSDLEKTSQWVWSSDYVGAAGHSREYDAESEAGWRTFLSMQLVRMLKDGPSVPNNVSGTWYFPYVSTASERTRVYGHIAGLNTVWDTKRQSYAIRAVASRHTQR